MTAPGRVRRAARALRAALPPRSSRRSPAARTPYPGSARAPYPGDFHGSVTAVYAPEPDGRPDPGEVVWTWVAFEDMPEKGKDRPVLVIGREPGSRYLLGLMLTSKDHDRDEAQELRAGRHWFDLGSGTWDPRGRPSEVRLDRILRVDPGTVRREGAVLDRSRFDAVVSSLARVKGWS